jgi:hypothetical protein
MNQHFVDNEGVIPFASCGQDVWVVGLIPMLCHTVLFMVVPHRPYGLLLPQNRSVNRINGISGPHSRHTCRFPSWHTRDVLAIALSSFYHFLEEGFDSVVDFAESLIAALEF